MAESSFERDNGKDVKNLKGSLRNFCLMSLLKQPPTSNFFLSTIAIVNGSQIFSGVIVFCVWIQHFLGI